MASMQNANNMNATFNDSSRPGFFGGFVGGTGPGLFGAANRGNQASPGPMVSCIDDLDHIFTPLAAGPATGFGINPMYPQGQQGPMMNPMYPQGQQGPMMNQMPGLGYGSANQMNNSGSQLTLGMRGPDISPQNQGWGQPNMPQQDWALTGGMGPQQMNQGWGQEAIPFRPQNGSQFKQGPY
jgi:hypothetical protein